MKKGLLIVLTGPSGVGKKTIWSPIINNPDLNLVFSVSMTTRKPSNGEVEGVDYFFRTKEQFEEAIKNGELLEYATFANNYYGTPISFVEKLRNEGKNVLLEIEPKGGLQVMGIAKRNHDDRFVSIFVAPQHIEELRSRLLNRKTESEKVIEERLEQAKWEIKQQDHYKYVIINKQNYPERSTEELYRILLNEIAENEKRD